MAKLSADAKRKAFLNTANKAKGAWKEARKTKPGEGFQKPDIEDGRYEAVITGECEVAAKGKWKGKPIVRLTATVQNCDVEKYNGVSCSQQYNLSDGQSAGYLAGDLKRIFPDREEEIEGFDGPGEIVALLDELNDNPVALMVTITNSDDGKYVNPRFEELVDGEGGSEESSEEETSEEEESSEEESGEEESSEEGDYEPEKGDPVSFRHKGRTVKAEVLTVNRSKQTVTVKTDKGTKYPDIAWDRLSYEGE